jgi:hypothetical protein
MMPGEDITQELSELMAAGAGTPLEDAAFDRLARAVFELQFEGCNPYRAFCERRGKTPANTAHWIEIPAVPTSAFKEADLVSDRSPAARVFQTSGTTSGVRGRHILSARALELYRASALPMFLHYMLPDLERIPPAEGGPETARQRPRTSLLPVVFGPRANDVPYSSLYFMIEEVCRAFCAEEPRHVLGPEGLDRGALRQALVEAEGQGRPMLLLGTALAFQGVCQWLAADGERFFLPEGSRIMETGGLKGSTTATTPHGLRAALSDRLGLDPRSVVSEYGMTEACSQFYEDALRANWVACEFITEIPDRESGRRIKYGPPWARAVICDPETLEPVEAGSPGALRLVDLANRFSISFLQTEDLAVAPRAGERGLGSAPFIYLGRVAGAEARGCSLVAEEWARATKGQGS